MLVEQDFPKPHEINPRVPEDLSEMVMACVRVKRRHAAAEHRGSAEGAGAVREVVQRTCEVATAFRVILSIDDQHDADSAGASSGRATSRGSSPRG